MAGYGPAGSGRTSTPARVLPPERKRTSSVRWPGAFCTAELCGGCGTLFPTPVGRDFDMAGGIVVDLPEGSSTPDVGAHAPPTAIPPSRARGMVPGNRILGSCRRVLGRALAGISRYSLSNSGYFPSPRGATSRFPEPTGSWKAAFCLGLTLPVLHTSC